MGQNIRKVFQNKNFEVFKDPSLSTDYPLLSKNHKADFLRKLDVHIPQNTSSVNLYLTSLALFRIAVCVVVFLSLFLWINYSKNNKETIAHSRLSNVFENTSSSGSIVRSIDQKQVPYFNRLENFEHFYALPQFEVVSKPFNSNVQHQQQVLNKLQKDMLQLQRNISVQRINFQNHEAYDTKNEILFQNMNYQLQMAKVVKAVAVAA